MNKSWVLILLPTTFLLYGLKTAPPADAVYLDNNPTPGPGKMRILQNEKKPVIRRKTKTASREIRRSAERKIEVKERSSRRAEHESIASRAAEHKAEFRKRLQKIRDQRKQKILERIDKRIVNINTRWTTHFTNVLDRLEKILGKLQAVVEKNPNLENKEVEALISQAQTKIETAQAAVDEQSQKEYIIDINDETALAKTAHNTLAELRTDLRNLRGLVREARQSVQNIFRSVKSQTANQEPES